MYTVLRQLKVRNAGQSPKEFQRPRYYFWFIIAEIFLILNADITLS